MASRLEQKERARAERVAYEEQQAAAARRTRRLRTLAAVGVVAIVLVAVAVVISSSGGSSSSKGIAHGTKANKTVVAVTSLLKGIPQQGPLLGSPRAPVSMVYFGDLQCPVCRDFTLQTLPTVIQRDVRSGKLNIQYKALETATPDTPTFVKQHVAALAAGRQNRMWQYVELFYHQQGQEGTPYVTEHYLDTIARQVPGLNFAAWRRARNDSSLTRQVRADDTAAQVVGADATPTLIFRGPHGKSVKIASFAAPSDIQRAITTVGG